MKRRRSNTLVALSSAAVMTVYAAGFMRTRAAAEKFEHASRERVPAIPAPAPAPIAETPMVAKVPKIVAPKPATVAKSQPAKRNDQLAVTTTPTVTPVPVDAPTVAVEAVPPPAVPTPPVPPPPTSPSAEILLGGTELHDGTYFGWGSSRHGDIQASVTILSGRITAVSIAQCRTRYSCDVIAHLPPKVVKDQTPEKINNVSGATQSVDAFYSAVVDAMSKAK
jgi:uncharacterized protein with FMN-binding domain